MPYCLPSQSEPDALNYLLDATRDTCLALASGDLIAAAICTFSTLCWAYQARIL